jgi:hypothetical protein
MSLFTPYLRENYINYKVILRIPYKKGKFTY